MRENWHGSAKRKYLSRTVQVLLQFSWSAVSSFLKKKSPRRNQPPKDVYYILALNHCANFYLQISKLLKDCSVKRLLSGCCRQVLSREYAPESCLSKDGGFACMQCVSCVYGKQVSSNRVCEDFSNIEASSQLNGLVSNEALHDMLKINIINILI